ncbi:Integral membrane protein YggT, involved in response to extracytoplasmic stress (osmotic shock) [hydrothermal vent metagenome]|uniref:Integral membrane protein YggT, involved in response to extracytoplasmic stress (Osmotic shock) n=1 Tax=hydrothermal vent metagenome TaxID=652676 RepID=A0A1W1EFB2_9ZZZZ
MNALIFSIVQLLHTVITIYIWIVIISALMSFVRPDPSNPIVQTLNRLTEPVYAFVRKKMPFLIMGGLDLTPLVIILGLQFFDTFMMRALLG